MARYLLLRIEDNNDADQLLADLVLSKSEPLLTPGMQHPVHAELVSFVRWEDRGIYRRDEVSALVMAKIRDSYDYAHELAYNWSGEPA